MYRTIFFLALLSSQVFCNDLHNAVVHQNYCEIVRLCENKSLLNEGDDDGNTALHLAAELGDIQATRILLWFGASVSGVNNAGLYPVHLASLNGFPAIISLLVRKGADINQETWDSSWNTPLHLARDVYTWNQLVHLGADTQKRNSSHERPAIPPRIEGPDDGGFSGG